MDQTMTEIQEQIQSITLAFVTLDGEDMIVMGAMLNQLTELKNQSRALESDTFTNLTAALEAYLERVVLREVTDLKPFETGLEHLQGVFRCMERGGSYDQDLDDVFSSLGASLSMNGESEAGLPETSGNGPSTSNGEEGSQPPENMEVEKEVFENPEAYMDDEERDIVAGFVVESMEGLETIEVSLMALEQNPEDTESVNEIFRSFHTIKGVSSFLKLMRINRLAHKAENLLDMIRCGKLLITPESTDVILESVDLLRGLIQGVQNGLDSGGNLDVGLDIAPTLAHIEAAQQKAREPEPPPPLGEIMVSKGMVTESDLQGALKAQESCPDKKLGELLVAQGTVNDAQLAVAIKEQKRSIPKRTDLNVKVDTHKLDSLVDMTGELVIAQAMLRQHPYLQSSGDQSLIHTLGQLSQITSSLQAVTMSLRMVPIKSTFQKMLRLVRDLSRNSGKRVRLEMSGEDTEIDRNVVDKLYEPMVHMIRNSVDHGLETSEDRCVAGKEPVGKIELRAYHRGGNIIVEIEDDGRGLNKDRIVEKAISNGLITDAGKLSDDEIYNLIFQPGFSTAKEVSEISGRGVGMDVVKKAIEKLRGRVDIRTRPGQGSTIAISLPLTLAIIEGMLVRVGKERYIIPALAIIECFRPTADQHTTVQGKGEMILSRGHLIPLVRLETIFGCSADVEDPCKGLVVTVEYDGKFMCLLLDELLGKEEVVIKSMGETMKALKGIAGGAIMGDGKVGLILDMAGIWQMVME